MFLEMYTCFGRDWPMCISSRCVHVCVHCRFFSQFFTFTYSFQLVFFIKHSESVCRWHHHHLHPSPLMYHIMWFSLNIWVTPLILLKFSCWIMLFPICYVLTEAIFYPASSLPHDHDQYNHCHRHFYLLQSKTAHITLVEQPRKNLKFELTKAVTGGKTHTPSIAV